MAVNPLHVEYRRVDRRIEWLRRKLYEYDEQGRVDGQMNPAVAIQRNIDMQDYADELRELMSLRDIADRMNQPTGVKKWQMWIVIGYATITFLMTALLFYFVLPK